ncbi:MAG: NAD(P)H-hydrate epimerase, partial [Gammaproteobacteria bacterium AqS3]|nr:NAD(P)H-hydrate epimerase [Gammaproteobacteria bacterium AqS3]
MFDADGVRAIERAAEREQGLSPAELMQRAGRAGLNVLRQRWPEARRLGVICGPGNNGGDGAVLAQLALRLGYEVRVWLLGEVKSSLARQVVEDAQAAGVEVRSWPGGAALSAPELGDCDVLVDALYGTGLNRPPEAAPAEAIRSINAAPAGVLSLDIPSGIDSDTGAAPGEAVRADHTVTFIARKLGLGTGAAPDFTGAVHLDRLGVDDALLRSVAPAGLLSGRDALIDAGLTPPPRARTAHKGDFGRV